MDNQHNKNIRDIFFKSISFKREKIYTAIGILLMVILLGSCYGYIGYQIYLKVFAKQWLLLSELIVVTFVISSLSYMMLVYLFTRLSTMQLLSNHKRESKTSLFSNLASKAPNLTVLIPSYKEEPEVIDRTLLSVALQYYPVKNIVLLIDDPAIPQNDKDAHKLSCTNKLIEVLQRELNELYNHFKDKKHAFEKRAELGSVTEEENEFLADAYIEASNWFEKRAERYTLTDYTDRFFVDQILYGPMRDLRSKAKEFQTQSVDYDIILEQYTFLVAIFNTKLSTFARKQYDNLSHTPNKAMNLNTYIGLVGKKFKVTIKNDKQLLEETNEEKYDISIPSANYLFSLDADSFVVPDYILRLISVMEKPGNEKIAIAQNPYTAIPEPNALLEHVVGTTTDLQFITHLGLGGFNADSWVGANYVMRHKALMDIKETRIERDFTVPVFIQDRTVIEDTESAIDIYRNGWKIYSYPERLSFSATPSDFGTLYIQRQRWSNGGLIIVPRLISYLVESGMKIKTVKEAFFRLHYLLSSLITNVALLLLVLYPLQIGRNILFFTIVSIPYLFFYYRDLKQAGYKFSDFLRTYPLFLFFIPIELDGVLASAKQIITKRKSSFVRTPKIAGRTATPAAFILLQYATIMFLAFKGVWGVIHHDIFLAGFSFFNVVVLLFAIHIFLGFRESFKDLLLPLSSFQKIGDSATA